MVLCITRVCCPGENPFFIIRYKVVSVAILDHFSKFVNPSLTHRLHMLVMSRGPTRSQK